MLGAKWCQEPADGFDAAPVATLRDLRGQAGGIGASRGEAFTQVGFVFAEQGGSCHPGGGQQFVDVMGAGEAADGLAVEAQFPADRRDRHPIRDELLHGGMPFPGAGGQPAVRHLGTCSVCTTVDLAVSGIGGDLAGVDGFDRCAKIATVPNHGVLHRADQVVPQVPPVGDLHRIRRADANGSA